MSADTSARDEAEDDVEASKMPLLDHLVELRRRLIYAFAGFFLVFLLCFAVANELYQFLAAPLADALQATDEQREVIDNAVAQQPAQVIQQVAAGPGMIFTSLPEVFFTYIKVAFFFAAFFTFPLFEIQFWKFVAPGLYRNEKDAFLPFLIMTPVLFFIGASFVYFLIFPIAWEFFLGFQTLGGDGDINITVLPKVNEYLSIVMQLIFAFGICFQLPVVMTLLARAGIASAQGMADKRKYAIVGVFVVAAVFTPPDPLSQILLAIPVIALYEISIIIARYTEKKRAEKEDAFAAEIRGE